MIGWVRLFYGILALGWVPSLHIFNASDCLHMPHFRLSRCLVCLFCVSTSSADEDDENNEQLRRPVNIAAIRVQAAKQIDAFLKVEHRKLSILQSQQTGVLHLRGVGKSQHGHPHPPGAGGNPLDMIGDPTRGRNRRTSRHHSSRRGLNGGALSGGGDESQSDKSMKSSASSRAAVRASVTS